jgi:hypothetical protein
MDKQTPDYSKMSPDEILKELQAKLSSVLVNLNEYEKTLKPTKTKNKRKEKELLKKMPEVEKVLELAFENQELIPPEKLEKFWKDNANFLIMKEFYEKFNKLKEDFEKNCPDNAVLYSTDSTTNNG